ncbi:MAG TPA: hypothetical protein VD788_07055 [Candidatus Polarisedimenticolaceae bacterium]|nr:hypothetical protein [Candidatus Polarisedimenticolaceae bacterium]
MSPPDRQRLISGMTLILLGAGLFWLHRSEGIGEAAVFFIVGGSFLAAYLYRRNYGLLVPAGILLGLGAGVVGRDSLFAFGQARLLGLGFGFVAIFVIALAYERKTAWWPLIPGAALILLGIPDTEKIFDFLHRNWPLLLVVAGVLVLFGAFGKPPSRGGERAGR